MKKNIKFIACCLLCITLIGALLIYDNKKIDTTNDTKTTVQKNKTNEKATTVKENQQKIYCIGDNQTVATNTKSYTQFLAELTGLQVETYALNNLTTSQIAQELGIYNVTIKNEVTIPAKTNSVNIELECQNHDLTLLQSGDIINPVTINNIEGTLVYLPSEKTYSFTRSNPGNEEKISSGTVVQTKFSKRTKNENDIYIIFTGYNDQLNIQDEIQKTIATQQDIISTLPNDRYIVVGLSFETMFPKVKALNDVFELRFTDHFLNYRYRVLTEDLSVYGIQWSKTDQQEIAQYKFPSSLKRDANNGNDAYNELLAKMLQEKMKQLNYIQ